MGSGNGAQYAIASPAAWAPAMDSLGQAEFGVLWSFLDGLPLAVVGLDAEDRVMYWNPEAERILGWTVEEVLGHPYPAVPPDQERAHYSFLERILQGESNHLSGDTKRRRKDGSPVDIAVWAAPLRSRAGEVKAGIGIFFDMTERKALERELRQAQKLEAVGRLAGGIAHDFNNLLTAVGGYADLLLDRVQSAEERQDLWEIRRSVDRATALTRRILAFSRSQVLDIKPLDMNRVVEEARKLVDPLLGDEIRVVVDLDRSLKPIRADAGQLGQIILNLAVNAADAMPGGGILTLATQQMEIPEGSSVPVEVGSYAVLRVSDTGVGMDEATLEQVFDPFFTTKEEGEGTGLGLSTVYGIVKQCEGGVAVESEPGKGTTFRVYLPTTDEPVAEHEVVAPKRAGPLGGQETVLVVEDERSVRSVARRSLEKYGYTVLEAATGGEALEVFEAHTPFDLLVTDLSLPGTGGWELAERLERERPGTRVLVISGHSQSHSRSIHVATHLPFLSKPFSPAELARKVRDVLDG